MSPECSFILSNGKKCRCAATRNQTLCRHHAPKPAVAGPPPMPKRDRYSRLMRWREVGANLQWMPAAEIPRTLYEILQCLIDRGPDSTGQISDLTAGRFLRVLLNRLGDVPFPDPEFTPAFPPQFAPASSPASFPGAPGVSPAGSPPDMRELNALLAALGGPASPVPMNQSRARVNQ